MDDGNRGDEAASRTGPFAGQRHHHLDHARYHQHSSHSHHHQASSDLHSSHQLAFHAPQPTSPHSGSSSAFDSGPSQIPVAAYAAANSHAYAANAAVDDSVDPHDFYRSYRSVPPADATLPAPDAMVSASVTTAHRLPTSLRSNGNGTTPKHPAVPAGHAALRPGFRSASNPVENRQAGVSRQASAPGNGYAGTAAALPTSVKDLKKKFDQTASPSGSSSRKNAPRPSRDTPPSTNGRSVGTGSSYAALRTTTATRDIANETGRGPGARSTQRAQYVAEDQASANAQSFASRISKPRNAASGSAQASKPSTQLAHEPSPASPPSLGRSNGLLFGEILPEDSDSVTVGFGIEGARPRRTSESSVQPLRLHMRSLSDPDPEMEPPSPTDWYRAAAIEQNAAPNYSGSQSGLGGPPATRANQGPAKQSSDSFSPASPTSPTSPTSRLPVRRKKNDRSNTTSPASTRSNSPATLKQTSAGGRSSRQHGAIPTRAKTPTSRSATPAATKTPNRPSSSARKPPPSNIATSSNGKLNAFVSVPAPKLSPSLRSSRPRQSVATATTAASRMRATDRGPSPQRPTQRGAAKKEETTGRRRKVSVGPIDFAQRRETIKLAYSKSIRDSQAREARQAAAEKRKKELEVVARVKLEAEAATLATAAAAAAAAANSAGPSPTSDISRPPEFPAPTERRMSEAPLKITTNLPALQPTVQAAPPRAESPTLGMPGSFPVAASPPLNQEEEPMSAVSCNSAITEFEIEEQTEPARKDGRFGTAAIDHDLGIMMPPQPTPAAVYESPAPPALHKRASYQYPFDDDDDDDGSIRITLDTSAQGSRQLTPTRSRFEHKPVPDAHDPHGDEYEPRPFTYSSTNYETTVTILGPDADFKPSHKDELGDTRPVPELRQADQPPAKETPEITASGRSHSDGMESDGIQIDVQDLDRLEDFYTGPRLRDNIALLRDSTPASSDVELSYGIPPPAEHKKVPDTSHSLAVPALLAPANRLSQGSAWTDFSFGSDDRDVGPASSAAHSNELDIPPERRATLKLAPSVGELSACESMLDGGTTQSPEYSPLDKPSATLPMLADSPRGKHYYATEPSPEVELAVPYSSEKRTVPLPPDHDPPPLPESAYQIDDPLHDAGTRPNSYLCNQEDESASSIQLTLTRNVTLEPSDTSSLGKVKSKPETAEPQVPPTEEQKRLRQRQLVIRELLDTEDVFVRDMSVVEEIYKGTAEACPKLDSKTIKLVFRNTDDIITFHASFLAQLREAASGVYTPRGRRSPIHAAESSKDSDSVTLVSIHSGAKTDLDGEKDRQTSLGPVFTKNIEKLKAVHEVYLRSSDLSTKRLVQIQEDDTVILWLNECNEVAKELTTAWNLDSLLIKPMQRITKYPDIITHLLKYTPADHPDREALITAKATVMTAIEEINKTKKNFELVGQIVGPRKRKESDVRAGIARAFGKRVDKLQVSSKTADDDEFAKLHERFQDDYLRLQVVLRDVEYYTRNVTTYVHEFLQYLSSMELVMRLQPSRDYAHLESKWVQFNVSMRDIEKLALEKHLSEVRKHVIEPFEQVIRCYGNPTLALKKRAKRRLDYEKHLQLKANGKKVDKQLTELVEQYEALNDTLKKELPKLSALTAKVGNICLGKFVSIQADWYLIWKEKVKMPLQDLGHVPEPSEIVNTFQREFQLQEERAAAIGILNPTLKGRTSQSTTDDGSPTLSKTRSRPGDLVPPRGRGLSINSDHVPTLPTPDFIRRNSGQFSLSPTSPGHYYRDYYSGINGHSRGISGSPITPEASSSRPAIGLARPSTGRSFESGSIPRQSSESAANAVSQNWRDSNSTYNSNYPGPETRRLSGLFHSALPLPDGPEDQRSSRASSAERPNGGYNVLWLAASLFEFNIETTKHEAGYPYLTYQAGEIFDVIAEKGELWLAKNQDDPVNVVGWIWSKHFAKLADS